MQPQLFTRSALAGPALSLALALGVASSACRAMDPGHAERVNQARAATTLGDWPRAAALWYGLYREAPGADAEIAAGAARALLESGDASSALAVVEGGRQRGLDGPELAHVAALALAALDQRPRAITELRDALVEDPARAGWWWQLAQWTWAEGQVRPTRRAIEQARATGMDSDELQLLAARVYTRLGDVVRAYDAWERALAALPDDFDAHFEAGRLAAGAQLALERRGALQRSVEWLVIATELEPQRVDAQRELANAARLAGDVERCLAALERASELDPTDLTLLGDLATLHVGAGDRERARTLLARALELESDPEWIAEWRRRLTAVDELVPAE